MSHPTRVRGSKLVTPFITTSIVNVAPHAGAWIETAGTTMSVSTDLRRTPRGCVDRNRPIRTEEDKVVGRTPRGCVDRNLFGGIEGGCCVCRTPRGCVDRNLNRCRARQLSITSHPTRVRGSKLVKRYGDIRNSWSRTPRGCVDRNTALDLNSSASKNVAPHAGAWIETRMIILMIACNGYCRTPRGCVDRNTL